ncbi:tetratricopeptide repeat protein [Zooshikella harenae]|uniref:Tetratricopeptide repeat protein n=1 Tax=Zooshikella harenae TaxID=2827238 RepID=A0ABS5ZLB0_9GAMM|nr:tetratricopeptide repeat protein [Zooshikella harenae]MBU2713907.1 tetratricopeptide repeat protein [Zooshikella harenae]
MKKLLWVILALTLTGCGSMARDGAFIRAQNNFSDGDFEETIEISDRALRMYEYDNEAKAQLLFLKAQSYQKLNKSAEARTTYQFIIDKYPNTEYAYRAKQALN